MYHKFSSHIYDVQFLNVLYLMVSPHFVEVTVKMYELLTILRKFMVLFFIQELLGRRMIFEDQDFVVGEEIACDRWTVNSAYSSIFQLKRKRRKKRGEKKKIKKKKVLSRANWSCYFDEVSFRENLKRGFRVFKDWILSSQFRYFWFWVRCKFSLRHYSQRNVSHNSTARRQYLKKMIALFFPSFLGLILSFLFLM